MSLTAGVAQLVEHLICNQRVRGSNPFASSRIGFAEGRRFARRGGVESFSQRHSIRKQFQVCVRAIEILCARFLFFCCPPQYGLPRRHGPRSNRALDRADFSAQVGEWLKPTDCKSVPPSEVRRFESFPVHQE